MVVWADRYGSELARLSIGINSDPYQFGDTWYRDMRQPGFANQVLPEDDGEYGIQWLAQRIVDDDRFAEAAVKFWWPAIMGSDVAEQPQEGTDADFEAQQMLAEAQIEEVTRLGDSFRRGFAWSSEGGYNLKDLLVEIAMSDWFRAESADVDDAVVRAALRNAGARRLLTPEELSRKTEAIMGFVWNRRRTTYPGSWVSAEDWTSNHDYGLLYGGIDSGGIAERARDLTPIMGGVAKLHGAAVACPVVMRDLFLLDDGERRLFGGVDRDVSPAREFGAVLEVEAESSDDSQTVSVTGSLSAGHATAVMWLANELWNEDLGAHVRRLYLDRIVLRDADGNEIETRELEDVDHRCARRDGEVIVFWDECLIRVPLEVPTAGSYEVEVIAWAKHDEDHDEPAKLGIELEGDARSAAGLRAVKEKAADLLGSVLGIRVDSHSAEVAAVHSLFVDVWESSRESAEPSFDRDLCGWSHDHYYLEGILDGAWRDPEDGTDWDWDVHGWNEERLGEFFDAVDWSDRHHVARTWITVLAYLLTDYRYLYL